MKLPKDKIIVYSALGMGLLIIGLAAIFIKLADAPGNVSTFYRMLIASAAMAIPFAFNFSKTVQKPPVRIILLNVLAGFLFGLDMLMWSTGLDISGATMPTLFANTAPVWVGISAMIIFKEKLHKNFWFGLLVAFAGTAIVILQSGNNIIKVNAGSLLGLGAGFFYGMYYIITQYARKFINTIQYFWTSTTASALTIMLGLLIFNHPVTGYNTKTWLLFLVMGIIVQVCGWLLLNYVQGHLPAALVSPTMLGQPVITAFFAILLLDEKFSVFDVIGGIIVIAGIFVVHRSVAVNNKLKRNAVNTG